MESPVFKLEKVVHSRAEELQDFEGPLDLILFLLGKNKMEIQDISISLICDQYLVWLDQRQRLDLEVASEFAAMASHLVYLKTRMLLSIEDEEAKSGWGRSRGSPAGGRAMPMSRPWRRRWPPWGSSAGTS